MNWLYDHTYEITIAVTCFITIILIGAITAICLISKTPEANELEGYPHERE